MVLYYRKACGKSPPALVFRRFVIKVVLLGMTTHGVKSLVAFFVLAVRDQRVRAPRNKETKTQTKTTSQAKNEGSVFRDAYPECSRRNTKEAFYLSLGEGF